MTTIMEERIATAQTDLASLNRVSHRLAMVDETLQLEKVLEKLLPRLLKRIGENHQQQQLQQSTSSSSDSNISNSPLLSTLLQQIQAKLMEIFSHILKRVRHDRSCQLPCAGILELFVTVTFNNTSSKNDEKEDDVNRANAVTITRHDNNMDSLTRSLSLTFLTLGLPRLCHETTSGKQDATATATMQQHHLQVMAHDLLPALLVMVADSSRLPAASSSSSSPSSQQQQQSTQWAHLLLHCLQGIATLTNKTTALFSQQQQPQPSNKRTFSNAHVTSNENGQGNSSSTSSSATVTTTTRMDPFRKARTLIAQHDAIGRATYDLFLDTLLYTPHPPAAAAAAATIAPPPPPGLSQAGRDRLCPPAQGGGDAASLSSSLVHWNNHPTRMTLAKLAIVEAIAPSRRMALFLRSDSTTNNNKSSSSPPPRQENGLNNNDDDEKNDLGLARTVALLVVATGSGGVLHHTSTTAIMAGNVAENATLYLKMHLDSYRGRAATGAAGGITTTASAATAFGSDPATLALELLTLCLGQHHAETLLFVKENGIEKSTAVGLGQYFSEHNTTNIHAGGGGGWSQQEILSTKRRAVSETMAAILLSFCASKILEENLTIFSQLQDDQQLRKGQQQRQVLQGICTLALNVSSKMLTNSGVMTTNMSKNQAKPQVAASSLLQALVAPLSIYFDNMKISSSNSSIVCTSASTLVTNEQGSINTEDSSVLDINSSNTDRQIALLLAKAVGIACHVLSSMITAAAVSTTSSTGTTASGGSSSEGSLAVRDHCYGVICTLSRCRRFVQEPEGFLFSQGKQQVEAAATTTANNTSVTSFCATSQSFVVSTETAVLLFGCAAHEEERLRPRATAALDALLAAYCRVANIDKNSDADNNDDTQEILAPAPSATTASDDEPPENPWAIATEAVSENKQAPSSNHVPKVDREMLARSLLPLLWMATQSHRPKASRIAAARWAGGLLKHLDLVRACHILCFLAGDSDTTVQGLANEGLGLNNKHSAIEDMSAELPHFGDFVDLVFQAKENTSKLQSFWDFAFLGKAAALRYALLCLMNDLYGGEDKAVGVYLSTLAETLSLFAREPNMTGRSSLDLLDEASRCFQVTISTSQFARRQIVGAAFGFSLREMESLALSAHSSRARRHLSGACAKLYEDGSLWWTGDSSPVTSLLEWLKASGVDQVLDRCSGRINDINKIHVAVGQQHGIAYLGANVVRAFRLQSLNLPEQQLPGISCFEQCSTILSALAQGTLHSDEVIANACADGVKIALSYDALDSPCLDERLSESSAKVLSCLARGLRKYGDGDGVDVPRVMKIIRASSVCLGATTTSKVANLVELGAARMDCVKALLQLLGSMSFRKDEEIGLIVGEALAQYADCADAGQHGREWSEDFDDDFATVLPPNEHVLYVLIKYNLASSSPHKRTAAAPAMLGFVSRAARGVNTDRSYENRPLVRTLLQHLDKVQALFIQLLVDPKTKHLSRESCCLGLAACRGLAKASDNASSSETGAAVSEMNHRVLRAFGSTTNFGGSLMQETSIQAAQRRAAEAGSRSSSGPGIMEQFGVESEVGGAAGMGEASLGAYREMAAASVSLGQPEMLYALLILSVSHNVWYQEGTRDRYSAASLLGEDNFIGNRTNSSQMREALRPHLGTLLPRILRARHDPNPQTREQMTSLWVGLTGGGAASRLAITQNLLTTLDVLIEDASSKLWRARVGALGGLAEIIVGRDWVSLGGGPPCLSDDDLYDGNLASAGAGVRLLRLWRVVTRALDDIRGAVRDSGETLGRSVRALTIRLCDPFQLDKSSGEKRGREEQPQIERDASAAAATSVRWIVKHGLSQPVPEAAGLCISTLTEIVGICRPKILESVLPDLLRSLLTAVSGLEPAALNYLQLRVDNQESLERLRLEIVQRGPLAKAVTKCLELLAQSSITTQQAVIPQLNTALRLSAGFATRAAVADAVATMCGTCQAAFSFPGVYGTSNPSVQLMRAFYFAAERERGQGAKDRMVHALGALAALCPGKSVRSLVVRACTKYNSSTGNQDDPASRRASAAVIRAVTVKASNQLSEGGATDTWTRIVLPVAFLGQKDEDKKIASCFREVWDEGGQLQLSHKSGTRLEEKLLPELTNECVRALQDVSWSRRVAGANALMELCNLGVLSPAPRSTGSSSMKESSDLLRARQRAKSSNLALQECITLLTKPRLWTGKSTIVETAVKIVAAWVAAEADKEKDARILYGWEDAKGNCPYQPVCLSDASLDDFFVGDSWFTTTPMDEADDETQKALSQETENDAMDVDDGGKLNFEEADSALPDEEADKGNDAMVVKVEEVFDVVTFAGLCRFLVMEALPETKKESLCMSDEHLPYRTKALHAFRDLMNSLPKSNSDHQRGLVFQRVANRFLSTFAQPPPLNNSAETKKEAPVIVAAAIESLGSCLWEGFGGSMATSVISGQVDIVDPSNLCTMLQTMGGSDAWTVREAALLGLAQLAHACDETVLRRPRVISGMMQSVHVAQKDRKFWRVRHAGLKLVENLVQRTGTSAADQRQLILETLLPYKEEILGVLRKSLVDSEPKVTSVSSEVLTKLVWWP